MLSKGQQKLITSLYQKKYRTQHSLFIAEGTKTVNELLNSPFKLHHLFTTNTGLYAKLPKGATTEISENELKKVSLLKSPNTVLAIFEIPKTFPINQTDFILALDGINDPGNLGTIIRLADWFGVKQLVCSPETADCYNPKVVQASMGSLARVAITYTPLDAFFTTVQVPVFTADMNGSNVYKAKLPFPAVLVMGNEANGLTPSVKKAVKSTLTIPRFGNLQQTESLNVATATAILLSEFFRNR